MRRLQPHGDNMLICTAVCAVTPAAFCLSNYSNFPFSSKTLYVGNLPFKSAWQQIKDVFSESGAIEFVKIPSDRNGR